MKDYEGFPPLKYFKRVLLSYPQGAYLYATLYTLKKDIPNISVKRKDIKKTFLISPTIFRNHLIALGRLDLIAFRETPEFFLIDFFE